MHGYRFAVPVPHCILSSPPEVCKNRRTVFAPFARLRVSVVLFYIPSSFSISLSTPSSSFAMRSSAIFSPCAKALI